MAESTLLKCVELIITGIEILAIVVIVVVIVEATIHYLHMRLFRREIKRLYHEYRKRLAQAILLGLEILIAADVIRTVVIDRTIQSIIVLGLLVVFRIILSWSLLVEIENHWPWQSGGKANLEDKEE
jgi:uncharacterized membrane protein